MNTDIYPQLKEIIKPYLPEDVTIDQVNKESHLMNDLNINSSYLVDIILDVEDAFDITIEDDEMESMDTVKGSISLINAKIEQR